MKTNLLYMLSMGIYIMNSSCGGHEEKSFAYGNFEAEEIMVSAESSGRLISFTAQEGKEVNHGELMGYTDTSSIYLQLQQLAARRSAIASGLDQIEKESQVTKISIKTTDHELERFKALYAEGAATRKQVDDLEGKLEMLKAQNDAILSRRLSIRAEVRSLEAQIKQVEDNLRKSAIICPSGGRILEIYAREGEFVHAGKPVFKMADLKYLTLYAYIDGSQLSSIRIGEEVNVLFDKNKDETDKLRGEIVWISDEAEFTPRQIQTRKDRVNLVYAVKITVKNEGSLKIGMPGEITLINK